MTAHQPAKAGQGTVDSRHAVNHKELCHQPLVQSMAFTVQHNSFSSPKCVCYCTYSATLHRSSKIQDKMVHGCQQLQGVEFQSAALPCWQSAAAGPSVQHTRGDGQLHYNHHPPQPETIYMNCKHTRDAVTQKKVCKVTIKLWHAQLSNSPAVHSITPADDLVHLP